MDDTPILDIVGEIASKEICFYHFISLLLVGNINLIGKVDLKFFDRLGIYLNLYHRLSLDSWMNSLQRNCDKALKGPTDDRHWPILSAIQNEDMLK